MSAFWGEIVRETDTALLVEIDGARHWLPKSKIEYDESAKPGDEVDLEIPDWLAEDRGL